jgi:predicted ArsR family transcriptional regulator
MVMIAPLNEPSSENSTVMDMAASEQSSASSSGIRPVDQLVLELLRRQEGLTVQELVERLEVTPTAVRMRLDRLEELGYLERRKQAGGRGRPVFLYYLSSLGWRQVGVTYADLATALWAEIEELPDTQTRRMLMNNVSRRMGQAYGRMLTSENLAGRLTEMANILRERKIPCEADHSKSLPVLTVHACPFPDLAAVDRRSACELEKEVLSQALGKPLELSHCRLDGHGTCQFRPLPELAAPTSDATSNVTC